MESLAKTLNAPKEVEIGGKTYKMSALTLNDLAAYEVHLKKERCKSLTELDMPKKDMYAEIVKINRENMDPDELIAGLNTITGIRWLLWRCVSKHDPEVDIDYISEQMDIHKIGDVFESALDMPEESEGEKSGKK
mgnify:CR=1 FL=1